jgi:hypothetical protein
MSNPAENIFGEVCKIYLNNEIFIAGSHVDCSLTLVSITPLDLFLSISSNALDRALKSSTLRLFAGNLFNDNVA